MAAGQMSLKILVPAGVVGVGLFLYVRHAHGGDLRLADWIIAGSAVVMSVLILCGSRSKPASSDDSEDALPGGGRRKWPLGIVLLPLLIWIVYSSSTGSPNASKAPGEGQPTAKPLNGAADSPRMIRTQAGEPDETGWVPALSSAGGFFVRLPERFSEATTTLQMNGRPTPVVIVGARAGDLKFVVLAARWQGVRDLQTRAKAAVKSLCQFRNPVTTKESLFEDKYPLIETEGKGPAAQGLTRIIATDEVVYGLAVEGPELTDAMRAAAGRFFDSFAIVTSEPNDPMNPDRADGGEPNQ